MSTPGGATRGQAVEPRDASSSLHYVNRARRYVPIVLVISTVLLVLSVQGAWWQTSANAVRPPASSVPPPPDEYVVVAYHLGGTVSCAANNWGTVPGTSPTPCPNVSLSLPSAWADLYSGLNAAVLALVGVGAVASTLGLLGVFGVRISRSQLRAEIALVVILALVSSGLLIGSVAAGPGPQGRSTCDYLSGNASNCPFFWGYDPNAAATLTGECTGCNTSLSWGAGAAFYQVLIVAGLCSVSSWYLWESRSGPFTREEEESWAQRHRSFSEMGITPAEAAPAAGPTVAGPAYQLDAAEVKPAVPDGTPPTAGGDLQSAYGRYRLRKTPWTCGRCGTYNSAWAGLCSRCGNVPPEGE